MSSACVAKEMPRRTLRKRTRAHVDPECKLASDVAPAAQRPRKGAERAPLGGLGINTADQGSSSQKRKKDSSAKDTRRRRSSGRIACMNMLRNKAAKTIQQSFRSVVLIPSSDTLKSSSVRRRYVDYCLRKRSEVALGDQVS